MNISTLILAMSIPSAITGFCFWLIEKKIDKQQKKMEKRETAKEQSELYLIKSVQAAIALGEATARAVQRIPDAHCNGDMHEALERAQKIQEEEKDFLLERGVDSIF